MAIPYTALLTIDELVDYASSGMALDLGTDALKAKVEGTISWASERIEAYCHRAFIVQAYSFLWARSHWWVLRDLEEPDDFPLRVYVPQWPVVQITAPTSGLSLGVARTGGQKLFSDSYLTNTAVVFFAGYRRTEQTLGSLQGETGLSAMTTLPGVLPLLLKETAATLALHRLEERLDGGYGKGRKVRAVAGATITVEAPDVNFVRRTLRDIDKYRQV